MARLRERTIKNGMGREKQKMGREAVGGCWMGQEVS